ncbi:putrescine transporter subunit: membrane component of ABC superfamily [Burkholderiales bacterium]|nr:putrescine transporter subunit: membrane component of ABC superfamily [Burkholderiales bacterium]
MIGRLGRSWLLAGYAFLYLPIVALIVFSFNESKMVSLWSGFSLRWYYAIFTDDEILSAVGISLKIAFAAASTAVVLGTLAAFAMVRYRRFAGRTAFIAHINAPLVVPEVITGLSLLLFFVACEGLLGGYSLRGLLTVWIGHTSICTAYAAVVIQARLSEVDRSIEEAAMDLGCRPFQVFYLVTLPAISQSLASAWLLTFTISLDDVVTTQFLNAPGSTTLPVLIFSRARLGLDPTVNAVATITVALVGIGVTIASFVLVRRERRREQAQAAAYREAMPVAAQ